ncbi:extracellular solute-binding protein [Pelagibacteraceae bacterium]|nr:extracellular solute-binding protein [Pelagibacteraceae bacterium]
MKYSIKSLIVFISSLFFSFSAFAGGHAYTGPDLTGQKVVMFGPWLSPEQETMREVGAIFEKATGATFEYGGSDSFEQQVMIDLKAGSAADLVVFPQPGLAANAAAMGGLVPLGDDIKQLVLDNYAAGQSWIDLSTYADENGNDQFNAIFFRTNVKSLVWYSPDNFEDNGYEVPSSMEELMALTEQMASDGNTPWCIGLGSGAAYVCIETGRRKIVIKNNFIIFIIPPMN